METDTVSKMSCFVWNTTQWTESKNPVTLISHYLNSSEYLCMLPVCSNTKTVTGFQKILFVDASDALKSGLHEFPTNPGANQK
jgi:hypothetical protein